MSVTYSTSVHTDELLEFLLDEHKKDTGIPVHPFSAVNSSLSCFDRSLGITDGDGTLFVTDNHMDAYGYNNQHRNMIRALRSCGINVHVMWW